MQSRPNPDRRKACGSSAERPRRSLRHGAGPLRDHGPAPPASHLRAARGEGGFGADGGLGQVRPRSASAVVWTGSNAPLTSCVGRAPETGGASALRPPHRPSAQCWASYVLTPTERDLVTGYLRDAARVCRTSRGPELVPRGSTGERLRPTRSVQRPALSRAGAWRAQSFAAGAQLARPRPCGPPSTVVNRTTGIGRSVCSW